MAMMSSPDIILDAFGERFAGDGLPFDRALMAQRLNVRRGSCGWQSKVSKQN